MEVRGGKAESGSRGSGTLCRNRAVRIRPGPCSGCDGCRSHAIS